MKRLLLLFAAFALVLVAQATCNVLTVHLVDNSKVDVVLSEDLRVSFDGDEFVADDGNVRVALEKSAITHFEHANNPDAISEIQDAAGYVFEGNEIRFYSLPQGSIVALYDAAGLCVSSTEAAGDCSISLDGLKPGVYVVVFNNNSFKISVK